MTAQSKDPREQLALIAELLIEDLFNTPDAEILKAAAQDSSLVQAGTNAKKSYEKAIQSIGAKRLEVARAEMKLANTKAPANITNIDAVSAHKIIAKLSAANDASFTLAARKLNNISDAEAIELVKELMELGAIKGDEL
jgi:hypothetical protein